MNKFKNEHFNKLYELMEKMDSSDDYLMVQVSALNPNKDGMEMTVAVTGKRGGKPEANRIEAEAALILAMEKDDDLKRLLTDAVMHYELYQAFKRRQS